MKRSLDLNVQAGRLSTLWKVATVAVLIALGVSFTTRAEAAVTFGASVTNANGVLSTTLTWSAPGATGCTAAGHPSWTGSKAASGTLALPPITLSGSYTLTLSCTSPSNAATTVTWVLPTTNTDGSPLTNLQGIRVNYGRTPTTMDTLKLTESATATSTTLGNLAVGDWYFQVRAYNTQGLESSPAPVPPVKKTVTAVAVENSSVTLTVNPIPGTPSNVRLDLVE